MTAEEMIDQKGERRPSKIQNLKQVLRRVEASKM